jgi:hypothetical protein
VPVRTSRPSDTDACKQPAGFRVDHFDWLAVDHGVQFVVELDVVGVDRVERLRRPVDELHRRWIVAAMEGIDLHAVAEHARCRVGRPST